MKYWNTITLSMITIMTLTACGGGGTNPIDNTKTAITDTNSSNEWNLTTPNENNTTKKEENNITTSITDTLLSCEMLRGIVSTDSIEINIKCRDTDGMTEASMKIKDDDGSIEIITLDDNSTSIDSNITFLGLEANSTYTIEANITSLNAKTDEIESQVFEKNVTTNAIIILDNTPPIISLNGDNNLSLTVGDTYTELGASASDDVDGDISVGTVIDSSEVDTSTVWIYTVKYNVDDSSNNVATEVKRTVNVVKADTSPENIAIENQTDLELSTTIDFNATITWINAKTDIQINNWTFVDEDGNDLGTKITVQNNDKIYFQATTSSENDDTVEVSIKDPKWIQFIKFDLTTKEAVNTAPTATDITISDIRESEVDVDLSEDNRISDPDWDNLTVSIVETWLIDNGTDLEWLDVSVDWKVVHLSVTWWSWDAYAIYEIDDWKWWKAQWRIDFTELDWE